MRKQCLFQCCPCKCYKGYRSQCLRCNHGQVWHKIDEKQFQSSRVMAEQGRYTHDRVMPMVPELPEDDFCKGLLPV